MEICRWNSRRVYVALGVAILSGCTANAGTPFSPAGGTTSGPFSVGAVAGRAASGGALGPVLTSANAGTITGWDVDAGSSYGLLSAGYKKGTALETFDLSTAKITKIGSYQPGSQGSLVRQFVVLKLLANNVALVDDIKFNPNTFARDDTFPTVSPANAAKVTGRWTPPHPKDLLVEWVGGNQSTASDAIMADRNTFPHKSAGLELLISDVAKNSFQKSLRLPGTAVYEPPYLVAQDTGANQVIVPLQLFSYPFDPFESPSFDVFDPATGKSAIFSPNLGSGSVMGMAIDPATHLMCTTTSTDSSVEFIDLRKQTGFTVSLPGNPGEGFGGGAVAVDPANQLFIVTQPDTPQGGSIVYVYDEKGNMLETITGFSFSNRFAAVFAYVAVNPKLRIGYATGPNPDQLQSFTY